MSTSLKVNNSNESRSRVSWSGLLHGLTYPFRSLICYYQSKRRARSDSSQTSANKESEITPTRIKNLKRSKLTAILKDLEHDSTNSEEDGDEYDRELVKESRKLNKRFDLMKHVGNGSFSKVYFGIHKFTREPVAIKIVDKKSLGKELPRCRLEIQVLKQLKHPNICELYQAYETDRSVFMVMEYCPKDLYDFINSKKVPKEKDVKRIFVQLVQAVSYIHFKGYAHRDLKPENVLLDEKKNAKLIDFNLCAKIQYDWNFNRKKMSTHCGTIEYAAPELIRGQDYDAPPADCWSLGITLHVLFCRHLPFVETDDMRKTLLHLKESHIKISPSISKKAAYLIRNLLRINPSQRWNTTQVLHYIKAWRRKDPLRQCDSLCASGMSMKDALDKDVVEVIAGGLEKDPLDVIHMIMLRNYETDEVAMYNILVRKKRMGNRKKALSKRTVDKLDKDDNANVRT